MHFLVDGYNYLHRARIFDARDLEGGRRRLAERLRVLRRKGDQLTIVWDAQGAPPHAGADEGGRGVEHAFARRTGSADDDIVARLRNADDPRRYCVVSDDGDVARPAKQLGARVLSVRDAEGEIARLRGGEIGRGRGTDRSRGAKDDDDGADEKPPPPGKDEADEWLRRFSENDEGDPK